MSEMHGYGVLLHGTKTETDARMAAFTGIGEEPAPMGQDRWWSDDRPETDEALVGYLTEIVATVLDDERLWKVEQVALLDDLLDALGDLRDDLQGRALAEPEWRL